MSERFDVLFAGQLLEGCDAATVRSNLGRLFKADEATLDKLFSGKPQILKRDADEATARKYQQALENAGARPVLRPCAEAAQAATPTAAATAPQAGLTLAPPGTDVLGPGERATAVAPSVAAPSFDVAATGEHLADPAPAAPPPPDTSHLTLGAVGADIPGLSAAQPVVPVAISAHLALEPEGGDLSDCAPPPAPAPSLDLSRLELADAGADVLEEQYRKRDTTTAPDTSRLSLED
ncbi:MAG: hypothetical protein RJQ10_13775 [Haliea sp.]|uniref:hypothetical protein n=1 Tax=Haliea sp. TaxID=1932666 RepID=UPI0032EECA31